MDILISFALIFLLVFLGIPFGLAFFTSALVLAWLVGYDPFFFLVMHGFTKVRGVLLLAIPLFILAGELMSTSRLAENLVGLAERTFSRIKGSLGVVANVSSALFGAVSGSTAATASCIGSIMIPRLIKRGYSADYSASLLAAASILGILIPPSIPMIIYGWTSGVSIAALFIGGIAPGLLIMIALSAFHLVATRSNKFITEFKPKKEIEDPSHKRINTITQSSLALFMPVIILGSIYGGIATATEAASIAVVYTIIYGFFVSKSLTIRNFFSTTAIGASKAASAAFALFGTQILARIYTSENVPEIIASFLMGLSDNKIIILILINVLLLLIGMIMDIGSGILIMTPLLLPLAKELGLDPLHFGVLLVTNLGVGYITPPVAASLYISQLVARSDLSRMMPIVIAMLLTVFIPIVLLVTFIPKISLFLPRLLGLF